MELSKSFAAKNFEGILHLGQSRFLQHMLLLIRCRCRQSQARCDGPTGTAHICTFHLGSISVRLSPHPLARRSRSNHTSRPPPKAQRHARDPARIHRRRQPRLYARDAFPLAAGRAQRLRGSDVRVLLLSERAHLSGVGRGEVPAGIGRIEPGAGTGTRQRGDWV
ncbi:hypothetical protein CALCODRAFT_494651, partial [Calocera cornea HHB12733]